LKAVRFGPQEQELAYNLGDPTTAVFDFGYPYIGVANSGVGREFLQTLLEPFEGNRFRVVDPSGRHEVYIDCAYGREHL
jgi:hypothetical protein